MAKKQAGKAAGKAAKEKIQLTFDADIAHKLRLAALAHRMDLSQFVSQWINREFSGLHIRGLNLQNDNQGAAAGQQGGSSSFSHDAKPSDRSEQIGLIARHAHRFTDSAIDDFVKD